MYYIVFPDVSRVQGLAIPVLLAVCTFLAKSKHLRQEPCQFSSTQYPKHNYRAWHVIDAQ